MATFIGDASAAIGRCGMPGGPDGGLAGDDTLERLHRGYLDTKERLLEAAAAGSLPIVDMDRHLRQARLSWRLADQAVHAAIALNEIRAEVPGASEQPVPASSGDPDAAGLR